MRHRITLGDSCCFRGTCPLLLQGFKVNKVCRFLMDLTFFKTEVTCSFEMSRTTFHCFTVLRRWAVTVSVVRSSLFLSSYSWMVYKLKLKKYYCYRTCIVSPLPFYILVQDYGHFDPLCYLTCHCIAQQVDTCYTWYNHNIWCTFITLCLICFISFGTMSRAVGGIFWNFFYSLYCGIRGPR